MFSSPIFSQEGPLDCATQLKDLEEDSQFGGFGDLHISPHPIPKLISFNPQKFEHRELKVEQSNTKPPSWLFGRGTSCNFRINHNKISNQHFKIIWEKDTFLIEDLSTNGTYISTKRIGKGNKRILQHHDIISLICPLGQNSQTISYVFEFQDTISAILGPLILKYQLAELLGSGNFSQVFRARENQTGKQVAIKIVDKRKYWDNPTTLEQIEKEATILTQLSHPHIIKLYEVLSTDSTLYLIMELADGGELFDEIRDVGFYSESHARTIFQQLLEAVHYLHLRDIAHRDLKPENILLQGFKVPTQQVDVKLTDFGLATLVGPAHIMKTTCGTPLYVAPEIIKKGLFPDFNGYGLAVDMWSLGAILYILLSGFPPFDDELDIYDQILGAKYTFPRELWEDVSPQAIDLIKNLLEVNPKKRFTAKQALEHPWISNKENRNLLLNSASKQFSLRNSNQRNALTPTRLFNETDSSTDEEADETNFKQNENVENFQWTSPNVDPQMKSFPKRRASEYDTSRKILKN